MKLLVTGGTGFLGRAIVRKLALEGHSVRVLVRQPQKLALDFFPPSVERMEGDILDIPSLDDAVAGQQAVIHSAGLVSFRRRDRRDLKTVNETGTANVVNAMLDAGVPRLVHISSTAALGRTTPGERIDEGHKFVNTRLDSYYGWSKHLSERQVARGVQEGLQAVMANPSVILGASDFGRSSGVMLATAAKGLKYAPPGANGFVALEDVAQAVILLLHGSHSDAERFILSGENLTYHQMFCQWAKALGKPEPKRVLNGGLIRFTARIGALFGGIGPVTPETAITLTNTVSYDNTRFRTAYNFAFTPIAETLALAARMHRAESIITTT